MRFRESIAYATKHEDFMTQEKEKPR